MDYTKIEFEPQTPEEDEKMDRTLKWFDMSLVDQMVNIGAELNRAIKWKNAGNYERKINFSIKTIELLGLTKIDPKHSRRFNEFMFYEQEIMDYLFGENLYNNTDSSITATFDKWLLVKEWLSE